MKEQKSSIMTMKKYEEKKQEINIEIYQKKKKIKKENMEEIDIIRSLKKLNKNAEKYFFS